MAPKRKARAAVQPTQGASRVVHGWPYRVFSCGQVKVGTAKIGPYKSWSFSIFSYDFIDVNDHNDREQCILLEISRRGMGRGALGRFHLDHLIHHKLAFKHVCPRTHVLAIWVDGAARRSQVPQRAARTRRARTIPAEPVSDYYLPICTRAHHARARPPAPRPFSCSVHSDLLCLLCANAVTQGQLLLRLKTEAL